VAYALLTGGGMNTRLFAFAVTTLALGCSSSSSSAPDAPVIDNLDVPSTTSMLTVGGQTGPGVVMTLTAHDASSGITALHVVFTETGQDQVISIPGNPTTIAKQPIELVVLHAPSGQHPLELHLTNANGVSSAVVDKTITVP
jgi:hypothetical protein